jgi:AcrR family transcriptional regulator
MGAEPGAEAVRRPGRPRSEEARRAVLDALRALVQERGVARVSIDAVAARAGVSKATIYRWWPNKEAIAIDALGDAAGPGLAFPDTGSTREDLRAQLGASVRALASPMGRVYAGLIGAGQDDPALAAAIRERLVVARRAESSAALRRGVGRGELRTDLDVDAAIDAIYGALYYRLLVSRAPLDEGYAEDLLAFVWPALVAPPAGA